MSAPSIEIGRLVVTLHGVSAEVVEAAAAGLEEEIRRRLGRLGATRLAPPDTAELALAPVRSRAPLDAVALRRLIAERLVEALAPGEPDGAREGRD